jgi:Ca2+-transporting ATPase
VKYLISCNVGELIAIFIAIMAGLASPLTPLQILWMNIVTDSPPALAIAMTPPDPDVMKRRPQDPGEKILTPPTGMGMMAVGVLMAAVTLAVFTGYRGPGAALRAGTMAFSVIILFQQFFALAASGSGDAPVLGTGPFRNRWLWAAFLFGLASQFLVTAWGPAQAIFDTVPLGPLDWGIVLLASSTGLFVPETVKWVRKVRVQGAPPVPAS